MTYVASGLSIGLIVWIFGAGELALPAGFISGIPLMVMAGLFGWPGIGPRRVVVVESLRWTWRGAWRFALGGLLFGALLGSVGSLIGVLLGMAEGAQPLLLIALWTVAGGLVVALMGMTLGGLVGDRLAARMRPNEGIIRSARSALVACGLAGLGIAPIGVMLTIWVRERLLIGQPTIPEAMFFWIGDRWSTPISGAISHGLLIGLGFGGFAVVSHITLRLVLWASGVLPLRLLRFLEAAATHVLLRKVGGGYIFVHRLLMEHFASMVDEDASPDAVAPTPLPSRPASSQ